MNRWILIHSILVVSIGLASVRAFAPHHRFATVSKQHDSAFLGKASPTSSSSHSSSLNLVVDPTLFGDVSANLDAVVSSFSASSTTLLAFADQGQNLAGIFFQASLVPYLLFLYFLQFRANRLTDTANFGFQFVLLFVLSTIPSGIISKSVYGMSLANVDWLHGGAETLLTVANVLIVRFRSSRLPFATTAVDITICESVKTKTAAAKILTFQCVLILQRYLV